MYDLIPGDVISGCVAFNGFYELGLTNHMARHAVKGGVLVDVGANMGYFSLLWAGLNPSALVVAFEGSPRNVDLFQNNVKKNHLEGRITVIPKVAGDHSGTISFDPGPAEQTGWGTISAEPLANSISVPMVRLDEQLPGVRIDVLKIDVEGADTLVLFGCERLLKGKNIKIIYFEQNPEKMEQIGIAHADARQFLRSVGYDSRCLGRNEKEWLAYPA